MVPHQLMPRLVHGPGASSLCDRIVGLTRFQPNGSSNHSLRRFRLLRAARSRHNHAPENQRIGFRISADGIKYSTAVPGYLWRVHKACTPCSVANGTGISSGRRNRACCREQGSSEELVNRNTRCRSQWGGGRVFPHSASDRVRIFVRWCL